jgi:Response regulator containing CheY-like receiver, AAA-type ATPase, and DNA-binding domains
MPLRHLPRIVGFEVPPLKAVVDVVRDAPIVGLLSRPPSRPWLDAFVIEAARTRVSLTDALVSIEGDHVLFFASASNARARCNAVRTMVLDVSKRVLSGRVTQPAPSPAAAPPPQTGTRQVLLVEPDDILREVKTGILAEAGWRVTGTDGWEEAVRRLDKEAIDALLVDIDLMAPEEGLELARVARERHPKTGVVLVTGLHDTAGLAVPEGALVLAKPHQRRQLLAMLDLSCGAADGLSD